MAKRGPRKVRIHNKILVDLPRDLLIAWQLVMTATRREALVIVFNIEQHL